MRYVKLLLLVLIAIPVITIFIANHQPVELTILPAGLEPYIGLNRILGPVTVPLWSVALGFLVIGLVLGFFWEWVREYKHRRAADQGRQSKAQLEAEMKKMKARENRGKDEILVLVEETGASAR